MVSSSMRPTKFILNHRHIIIFYFFAVLLSPVLDGFDQLLSFLLHCPCSQLTRQHEEEREKNLSEKILETPRFEPGAVGLWSLNAMPPPHGHTEFIGHLIYSCTLHQA